MSQISDKNMTESKGFCTGRRKKNPRTNSRDSNARNSPLSDITSGQPPRGRRALLCCVSYKDQKFELKGTSLDLKNMMDLLEKQLGFPRSSILILAEKEQYKKPTRKNIEAAFDWLMRGIQPGDSLLFYFSGHGLRQRGINGDEVDGYDECICPMDFETNGYILDNYIKKKIVEPLVTGVKLHAIIDSCHSGTVLDLPHVYNMSTGQWEAHHTSNNEYKGTSGGKAICISACEDYQLAADTSDLSPDNEMSGAMTWTFIKAVKSNKNITYRGMLEQMHMYLKRENKVGCVSAGLRRVFRRKILQDPLLSSSHEFDTNTEFTL